MILDIDKVLCRETSTDISADLKFLKNKRILIVGAGGSIGSELCRQMLFAGAKRLFLFGHGEDSIYKIYERSHTIATGRSWREDCSCPRYWGDPRQRLRPILDRTLKR